MPATIFEVDMMNLFCDDDDPTSSQYLTIEQVKLPQFQEKTKDHTPGGGVVGIKIGMRVIEPLVFDFKLRGYNPDVMSKFMVTGPQRRKYTARANIRDLSEGTELPLVVVIEGRMVKIETDQFKRDDGVGHDYQIAEIFTYNELLAGQEVRYFDFRGGPAAWRINGVAPFLDAARNLGLL